MTGDHGWAGAARPHDHDVVPVLESLHWQHSYCRDHGSPVAALILQAVHDDVAGGGPLAGLVPAAGPFGMLPGLRLMAATHRLAIDRLAPDVALHLPTLGGTPPPTGPSGARARADFRAAVVRTLASHPDVVRESLARTPQTNEVGRAALLRCALTRLGSTRPVRLREIGASAGLNLLADQLPGDHALERGPLPPVVDRLGCDLDPVDPATPEGRLLLSSYVWVDDVDRFTRLGAALEVAARIPVVVERADAADFVSRIELRPGTTTVLWHSAMWVYLPADARRRTLEAIAALGAAANERSRFAHVSWEWAPDGGAATTPFDLVLRRWEGGDRDGTPVRLATGSSHGYGAVMMPSGPQDLVRDPLSTWHDLD